MRHIQPSPSLTAGPSRALGLGKFKKKSKAQILELVFALQRCPGSPGSVSGWDAMLRGAGLYKSADLGMIPLAYELLMRYEL